MVQLLAYNRGKSLSTYLAAFPSKEFDSDAEYFWDVVATAHRNIPIVEARTEDNTVIAADVMAGVNNRPFYVVFAEDWFANGEVIVGELNEAYPLRVLESGRPEGTNTVYKVELMGGVMTGMPGSELQYGKRFSIDYAPVERELSRPVSDRLIILDILCRLAA